MEKIENKNNIKNNNEDKDISITDHLIELRSILLKCLLVLGIILPITFFLSPRVLNKIIDHLLKGNEITLNYFSPIEVFVLQIKIACVLDLLLCCPYITYKIWGFIVPGLYPNERRLVISIAISSSILFITGVVFCFLSMIPLIIKFGLSFETSQLNAVWGISQIISLSLWLSVIFGVMFQIPLIIYYLIKFNVISYESVASKRSYIIVIILIISGILTPPDVVSQILLAIPTYLLFEIGLFFSKRNKK